MKYNIFLMDADETLLDFKASEKMALKETFLSHGVPYTKEALSLYEQFNQQSWERWERKEITREQLGPIRFALLFEALGLDMDPSAFQDAYMANMALGGYVLPGAVELVQKLSQVGKIYILTNGFSASQHGRMEKSGLMPYVSGLFISEELGVQKPDLAFFETVFAQIPDFEKSRALMIGDSAFSDMQGGIGAGVDTCWYNPAKLLNTQGYAIDYTVQNFEQLYQVATQPAGFGLANLKEILIKEDLRCVAADANGVVFRSDKQGIAPMLDLYQLVKLGQCAPVYLCDRVFGKGAVLMAKLCGISQVYSVVASQLALECAADLGVVLQTGEAVPYIINRTKDGCCPIEQAVSDIFDPEQAYAAIVDRLAAMKAK